MKNSLYSAQDAAKRTTLLMLLLLLCTVGFSQVDVGLSFGFRHAPERWNKDSTFYEGYVRTQDSTLQFSSIDHSSIIISGCASYYPLTGNWARFGFVGNINLLMLTDGMELSSIFNQRVEGGVGLSCKINNAFAVAFTFEKYNNRQIREGYRKYVNQQLFVNGVVVTDLKDHRANDSVFRDDYLNAFSLKFIVHI